jgi:hypothetical protein
VRDAAFFIKTKLASLMKVPPFSDEGPAWKAVALRSVLPSQPVSREDWEMRFRPGILAQWKELLGSPSFVPDGYDRTPERIEEFHGVGFRAVVYRQPTGPGQAQRVIILVPDEAASGRANSPRPCAVVPFYHPEQ